MYESPVYHSVVLVIYRVKCHYFQCGLTLLNTILTKVEKETITQIRKKSSKKNNKGREIETNDY